MSGSTQRTPGGGARSLLDSLKRMQAEDAGFSYAIQSDSDQGGGSMFWADASSKMNYDHFGDTVMFDTTYKKNGYRVPFVSFTGLNHHGLPVLFGCGLILNESESSFVWLLQTWLQVMYGRSPVSITTDPDGVIQAAVSHVLPNTRLRFCKQSVLRETLEKLADVCQSNPSFEVDFKICINEMEMIDEFEQAWRSLRERYYVVDNDWLQSMYNARQQWVPVFVRDTFFGELSATEGNSTLNSYFEGYVNASTTMQTLIKQYEKAVSSWHEKELKADYDTASTNPVLKTPSPMEKQAASLYTRRIFMKFQEELVETLANPATKVDDSGSITTYRVAKFGEDHKARTVGFNSFEMKANCSCQMFEYSGIICRHVLAVFRAKNVLTLPSQYVLKRWTRNAKIGSASDECTTEIPMPSQESLTIRCNNLRQAAIKFVEDGAKSVHAYHVAMNALREASKKVEVAKNKAFRATKDDRSTYGSTKELHAADENKSNMLQSTEEKEKKIHELTAELECVNQRCDVYRTNLLAVLRDMEDQKQKLSVKVQNAKLSLRE